MCTILPSSKHKTSSKEMLSNFVYQKSNENKKILKLKKKEDSKP